MRYDDMKELYDSQNSQMTDKSEPTDNTAENAADETTQESTCKEKLTSQEARSGIDHMPHEPLSDNVLVSAIKEQSSILEALLAGMSAQAERLADIESALKAMQTTAVQNRASAAEIPDGRISTELALLKDAFSRQEKANTDILRDSKNFQAGVKARMQEELDSYHKQNAQNAYAPILTDIAGLYISIKQILDAYEDCNLKTQLENALLDSLTEMLEDNGVSIKQTQVGEPRSLRLCKTRKTVLTADAELSGRVAKSYNPSFVLGNLVLQKEIIDTYVYDAALDEANKQSAEQEASAEGDKQQVSDTSEAQPDETV